MKISLSFVVIGLNEARNLSRCFTSIRRAVSRVRPLLERVDVVYVDSGSSDGSPELARRYADRVQSLKASEASAAAARAAGLAQVSSDWVLFLDGDMELDEDWLARALPLMASTDLPPNTVGFSGIRDDIFMDEALGHVVSKRRNVYGVRRARRAPHIGGAFLARTCEIAAVGGFRSELRFGEEPDLYARLLARGKRILELPVPFVRHYTKPRGSVLRRLQKLVGKGGSAYSFGQAFWLSLRDSYLGGFLKVYRYTLVVWIGDIASISALLLTGGKVFLAVQTVLLLFLLWCRKATEYVAARARLYGVLVRAAMPLLECLLPRKSR